MEGFFRIDIGNRCEISQINISQYNKEIDDAIARVEAGDYLTQQEVENILKDGKAQRKNNWLHELDVDVIGGLGPLTKEDEKAVSDFIQARKKSQAKD